MTALRVVHVYKDYPPVLGGIEQHLALLAGTQARRGFDVSVVVAHPAARRTATTIEGGVRVVRVGRWATVASTPIAPAMPSVLRRLAADVVHLHFPHPMGEVAHWLGGRPRAGHGDVGRRATVVTYHSDIVRQRWLGRLYGPFLRRILGRADRVLATSRRYAESSPVLRRLAAKVEVVPLGIDVERFARANAGAVEAARGHWPSLEHAGAAPLRVLFVGRLRYYKGVEHLIDAMAAVPGRLVVAGDGPRGERLRARARGCAAAARIRFLGDVADDALPALYAAADVVVLPSVLRAEAFGIVQVEAMAAGTPVVATELGTGTSEVNVDGVTGLVVPPADPRALAGALRALFEDPERRRAMGRAAAARARDRHDIATMARALEAVYDRALAG